MIRLTRRWFCGAHIPATSYFGLFGVPVDCDVNAADLQRRFYALQARIHPDKAHAAANAAAEQRAGNGAQAPTAEAAVLTGSRAPTPEVLAWLAACPLGPDDSAAVNVAYETLRDAFLRAKYLASLDVRVDATTAEVLPPSSDRRSEASGETNTSLPHEFLMDMMEFNERLGDIDAETAEGGRALAALGKEVDALNEAAMERARESWKARDVHGFRDSVARWTYVHNLRRQIRDLK